MRPQKQGQRLRQRLRSLPVAVFFLLAIVAFSWRVSTAVHYLLDYDDDDIQARRVFDSFSRKFSLASSAAKATKPTIKPPQQFILSDGTVVSVGEIGPNVTYAIQHAFVQRNQGLPWYQWDIVENPNCDYYPSTNHYNVTITISSSSSFATLSMNTPKNVIRKHWLPEALLMGVQKGGTTALYEYLERHPDIAKSQKELYFLDEVVDQVMLREQHQRRNDTTTIQQSGQYHPGIPQITIRQKYSHRIKLAIKDTHRDAGKMILDLTPNYMYQSDRLPARITCVLPWAKIMVLLRNPVHRARSQYDMKVRFQNGQYRFKRETKPKRHQWRMRDTNRNKRSQHNKGVLSFQQYLVNDLAALQETGVIQNWEVVDFDTFFDSPAMDEAWRTYLNCGLNAPIGMGLYAIQLKPFLQLDNDFLPIQSEKLVMETDETYGRVLEFLGLQRISLDWYHQANIAQKREKTKVDQDTERLLYQTFAPFNRKLGELLGKEWVGVWEENL
jgi:Sulfotransferase family